MKNTLLLFSMLLLGWTTVSAQFILRPQVGLNSSSLTDAPDGISFKDQLGFQIGIDAMIGGRVYIQPGFQYELVKNTVEPVDFPGLKNADLKVSRVRIPLMFGYRLIDPDESRLFNFRLFTGPNAAIVTTVDDGESQFAINKDDFKTAVFGWTVGAGIDLPLIFADFGYQFGLSKVFEDLNIQGIKASNSKNNLFYLSGGIRIQF